jgi:mannose-6-phosphate isomerase-like protein (cupin superfamily)
MRITRATLCALLVLGGCDRRGYGEAGAELDRSDKDTVATTAEAGDTAPVATRDTADAGLNWGPGPPFLPTGARAAVLEGDPGKPGPFRIQLDMPDGYEIQPHHHPMSEHISVVKGNLWIGRGKEWDDKKLSPLTVGDSADMAAKESHYVRATLRTVIEVRSTGPFEITYVNPAADPRKATVE